MRHFVKLNQLWNIFMKNKLISVYKTPPYPLSLGTLSVLIMLFFFLKQYGSFSFFFFPHTFCIWHINVCMKIIKNWIFSWFKEKNEVEIFRVSLIYLSFQIISFSSWKLNFFLNDTWKIWNKNRNFRFFWCFHFFLKYLLSTFQ